MKKFVSTILCSSGIHIFEKVNIISPIVLNQAKHDLARVLYEANETQGTLHKAEMSIIKAEVLGDVDQNGLVALEQYNALTRFVKQVFCFEVCKGCGSSREIPVETEEAKLFVATMCGLLRKRIYNPHALYADRIQQNEKYAKKAYGKNMGYSPDSDISSAAARTAREDTIEKFAFKKPKG